MKKPRITAKVAGRPLHPMLRPLALGYFFAACVFDLVFAQVNVFMQVDLPDFPAITEWLLGAGLLMLALQAAAAFVDLLGDHRFRTLPDVGMLIAGDTLVAALALRNLDLRLADGVMAIAPVGALLSVATVAVMLAAPAGSWARMYR